MPPFARRRDPSRLDVPPLRALHDRSALPPLPEPSRRAVRRVRTRRSARVQQSRFLGRRGAGAPHELQRGVSLSDRPYRARDRRHRRENGTPRPRSRETRKSALDASRDLDPYSADITKTGDERDEYPSSVSRETRWLVETGVATAANGPGSLRTERPTAAATTASRPPSRLRRRAPARQGRADRQGPGRRPGIGPSVIECGNAE